MTDQTRRQRGMQTMADVYSWGDNLPDVPGEYFSVTAEHLFGDIWNREGLTIRERRLMLFGAIAALGETAVLPVQLDAALAREEFTPDQLRGDRHLPHALRRLAPRRGVQQPRRGADPQPQGQGHEAGVPGTQEGLMIEDYDVVVVGTGAAGLTGALRAATRGWRVLVLEKDDVVGGTAALTGGGLWAPTNRVLRELGMEDSLEEAQTYLDSTVGDRTPRAQQQAFLHSAAATVDWLAGLGLRFNRLAGFPDYSPDRPGGRLDGRAIAPKAVTQGRGRLPSVAGAGEAALRRRRAADAGLRHRRPAVRRSLADRPAAARLP